MDLLAKKRKQIVPIYQCQNGFPEVLPEYWARC